MKSPIRHRFRLYVAGGAENSLAAIANLRSLCEQYLPHEHDVELIDVLVEPMRALADGVLMTPMLIRIEPFPQRKIVGSLADLKTTLVTLGLPLVAA
jgi:circadian clock protein KaiB